jgi:hypothetical protein
MATQQDQSDRSGGSAGPHSARPAPPGPDDRTGRGRDQAAGRRGRSATAIQHPPAGTQGTEAAAAQRAYRRWLREQEQAEQRLGELGSTRHHLIEVARAAAHAQVARYQQLAELYHTAFIRRDPDGYRPGLAPVVNGEPWLSGDLPLICLEIDGSLAEKYRWRLKDFASRTSAVPVPVGDVAPNRN